MVIEYEQLIRSIVNATKLSIRGVRSFYLYEFVDMPSQ